MEQGGDVDILEQGVVELQQVKYRFYGRVYWEMKWEVKLGQNMEGFENELENLNFILQTVGE